MISNSGCPLQSLTFCVLGTVNVHIFAQLNFRAHTSKFYVFYYDDNFHSHQIFAHLKPARNARKYVLRENVYVYSISTRVRLRGLAFIGQLATGDMGFSGFLGVKSINDRWNCWKYRAYRSNWGKQENRGQAKKIKVNITLYGHWQLFKVVSKINM